MSRREPAPSGAFFDDDYRRVLEPFHAESEARTETAALRELLGLSQGDRVLDLGCGWGRHLSLLHQAGHDVTGLDLSLPLLRHVHVAGVAGAPVAAGDMLQLPFRTASFDVVLNLATSFGLFLDDGLAIRALREVRRVLRPRGRLLMEGMHRDDVVAGYAGRDRWELDDGTEVRVRRRFNALTGVSHEVLRWGRPRAPEGRGGAAAEGAGERVKRHSLRLRTATELIALLGAAELTLRQAWGDWDGETFQFDSPRLIVVATPADPRGPGGARDRTLPGAPAQP